ncbi:hypothetical protein TBLA_0A00480 [Henningerozyma blattae CBS 6284]|uniref:Glycosyltransferase family 15 protein n=1 Tax=Henningerozyma blattae (strain ATCC 34711 / CBS 6284 / DSM 70876 / NBRC 10599 / NRRL Y-10934 / UCD 77-7) TaxID=1071380 RepID=I2GUP6_HENB6|nr:hypothetical protein TBLA_0A00480 [Tetrapisispora blattae CBS 6284]CCH57848.1 hypothetical protein TBLA_0A00480 [Tetrapisispora blattae CBS 6284]
MHHKQTSNESLSEYVSNSLANGQTQFASYFGTPNNNVPVVAEDKKIEGLVDQEQFRQQEAADSSFGEDSKMKPGQDILEQAQVAQHQDFQKQQEAGANAAAPADVPVPMQPAASAAAPAAPVVSKEDMAKMRKITPESSIGKYETDTIYNDTMEYIKKFSGKPGEKVKACMVSLVRNSEVHGMVNTIKSYRERFISKYPYPWIFLNDEEFTEDTKSKLIEALPGIDVKFGLVPTDHWSYPTWINQDTAAACRKKMGEDGIIYGDSESYRHMCRYQSGFFWRHELLDDYDWYWRVEPDTNLHCDVNYDVFQWMQDNNKMYGFTITIHEYLATIPTLWDQTKKFFKENPSYLNKDNLMKFVSHDQGDSYNLCHYWSNFEIANLHLWRSPAYRHYFDTLDRAGGFFYERWGDAPVHSIAASLFLPKDSIHFLKEIGYWHPPYNNCPIDDELFRSNNCDCDQNNDFTFQDYACGKEYYAAQGFEKPSNWERARS